MNLLNELFVKKRGTLFLYREEFKCKVSNFFSSVLSLCHYKIFQLNELNYTVWRKEVYAGLSIWIYFALYYTWWLLSSCVRKLDFEQSHVLHEIIDGRRGGEARGVWGIIFKMGMSSEILYVKGHKKSFIVVKQLKI